ncbi:MAG: DUF2341 domain-containing protein [Candidatus Thorarchaeota archaeon]
MKGYRQQARFLYILFLVSSILIIYWVNCDIEINNFTNDKKIVNYNIDSGIKLSSNPPNEDYFAYYKEITINHLKVAEDLNNFPLLISLSDVDLHSGAQADGDDIAFSNGTIWLDHEIERFDKNSTHARLVAWIRIPSLSSTSDTKIYMYYGNSSMTSRQNPSSVWSSDYKAVWHLNTTLLDSTSNNNDGTNYGADDVLANIGRCRDYNGIDDSSNMGSGASLDNVFNGGGTISAWIFPEGWGGGEYGRILAKTSVTDGTDGWVLCLDGGLSPWYNQLLFYRGIYKTKPPAGGTRGLWMTGDNTISLDQWQHVVVTYNDSVCNNYPIIYINGVSQSLGTDPAPPDEGYAVDDSSQSVFIGNYEVDGNRAFDGVIDEVRITSGIKSSGWVLTEYRNQNDPNSFYTVSAEIASDTLPPNVTINSPNQNDLFGDNAPNFNVEIDDNGVIDKMWYRLSNGTLTTVNTTFTNNETISETRWDEMGNGTVTIQFFANDSSGNEGFSEVNVRKDINPPSTIINSPNNFDLFGSTAPDYNVEILEPNGVDYMWYTLNNGIETYFSDNGTISQSVWDLCGNGTVSIKFYANDSLSNEGFSEVVVRKEIESPTITINFPNDLDLFGSIAPNYNVEIWDSNGVDTMWYTLKNGIDIPFTQNGTISQSNWSLCGNGTVSIKFYANNSLGNTDFSEVIVRKDVINPVITINTPDPYELYGSTPPSFNVIITDPNGVDTKWYTLDSGITNKTFISNGIIDQGLWEPRGNGTVTICFYANDSLGNEGYEEVIVRKDIEPPSITINSPVPYELFGVTAPNFNVEINDSSSINTRWYTIDGGETNITFTSNGSINQMLWSFEENGTVTIKFYARDSLGNEGFSEVIVRKDIDPPSIIINSPNDNDLFNETAPNFNVEINSINGIDTMWYSLDEGLTKTIFTTNESINQAIWDNTEDGYVTLQFYANNSIGTTGFSDVSIIKDVDAPKVTINNPYNNSYCNKAPIINVYSPDINLDSIWYEVNTSDVLLENNLNQQLDPSIWSSLPEGEFYISIYSNDTLGHLNNTMILMLYKDTIKPDAPILLDSPEGEVSLPIIFDWENGNDTSGISYYRLIIDNEDDPFSTPGFIFEINITNTGATSSYYELTEYLNPRNYHFFIYQVDGAGNQGDAAHGTFTIAGTSGATTEFPWWLILIIAIPLGLALAIVGLKKSKKKEIQVVIIDKELDKLKEKRTLLDTEAKSAIKAYNYIKAAEIYEQCAEISQQLYKEGDKIEEHRYKNFKDLEAEARSKAEAIPLRNACINKLLTKFFDENGIRYYSDPQIYPENQETINGLILNENNLLQNRFTQLDDSPDLAKNLDIDFINLEHINAIQILYATDLSIDALIEYCQKYQNPDMILYIVGIIWPAYNYEETINLPKDSKIKYPENIKIINVSLFYRIFLLNEQYQREFQNIINLNDDLIALKEIYESTRITLHDTTELKDELKQKGLFFLI